MMMMVVMRHQPNQIKSNQTRVAQRQKTERNRDREKKRSRNDLLAQRQTRSDFLWIKNSLLLLFKRFQLSVRGRKPKRKKNTEKKSTQIVLHMKIEEMSISERNENTHLVFKLKA